MKAQDIDERLRAASALYRKAPADSLRLADEVLAELEPDAPAALRGQILRVRVDDPSARVDVPAWCALTGHTLLGVREGADGVLDFAIRKEAK